MSGSGRGGREIMKCSNVYDRKRVQDDTKDEESDVHRVIRINRDSGMGSVISTIISAFHEKQKPVKEEAEGDEAGENATPAAEPGVEKPQVISFTLRGMGSAIDRTASIAEIARRRVKGLASVNWLFSSVVKDDFVPRVEGLDVIPNERTVSGLQITLSKESRDALQARGVKGLELGGYQAPLPEDEVDEDYRPPRRQGRGRGRGRGRGGRGRGRFGRGGRRRNERRDDDERKGDDNEPRQDDAPQDDSPRDRPRRGGRGRRGRGRRGGRGRGGGNRDEPRDDYNRANERHQRNQPRYDERDDRPRGGRRNRRDNRQGDDYYNDY